MIFRLASPEDAEAIALLHAQSWQKHYRGIFLDHFLDYEVEDNRREVWGQRLHQPIDNQLIIVAESEQGLLGFVCVFAHSDAEWGALVDNLHARAQGKGIGKILLSLAANWVKTNYPNSKLHLWVLAENYAAQGFYDKMGGKNIETTSEHNPGGGTALVYRYVWEDLGTLSFVAQTQNIQWV
jgi:GNAT superfamily N-acetyltransferase